MPIDLRVIRRFVGARVEPPRDSSHEKDDPNRDPDDDSPPLGGGINRLLLFFFLVVVLLSLLVVVFLSGIDLVVLIFVLIFLFLIAFPPAPVVATVALRFVSLIAGCGLPFLALLIDLLRLLTFLFVVSRGRHVNFLSACSG